MNAITMTLEAIYEQGVFKPKKKKLDIPEHTVVQLMVKVPGVIARQRKKRLQLDSRIAREIAESADYSLLEV